MNKKEKELKQWALNDYKEIRKLATQECALDRMIERLIEKTVEETRKQVLEIVINWIKEQNCYTMAHILDEEIDELKQKIEELGK